jgi:hypothetical protein
MVPSKKITVGTKRPLLSIRFPHVQTITVLALGFLGGNLLFLPMISLIGKSVPGVYQESVATIAALFKDGMLLILGYYFRDRQPPKDPTPIEVPK